MRPRKTKYRTLPPNLYCTSRTDGRRYYFYKHPETGKTTGFGYDLNKATDAATQLNQIFCKGKDLVAQVLGGSTTLRDYITHYTDVVLPQRRINGEPLSDRTLSEYRRIIRMIDKSLGLIPLSALSLKDINDFLAEQSTAETANKARFHLARILRHAVSEGKLRENLAEKTLKRDKEKKKRKRLSIEGYQEIYKHANKHVQAAMELALNLMQRREDIRNLKFTDAKEDGYFYIEISKTKKHGKHSRLRIPLNLPLVHSDRNCQTLKQLIDSCRNSVVSPYLVHRRADKRRQSKEKDHWTQLSPEQISGGFAAARKRSKFYDNLAEGEAPSFHEIISLGQRLRKDSGWKVSQLQTMRGHSTAEMTENYLMTEEWTTFDLPEDT